MFRTHSLHIQPKNTRQVLWRYIQYNRLVQLIEEEAIYFSRITQMDDKWEGLLTNRTREQFWRAEIAKYNGNIEAANGSVRQYEESKNDFYINCWHMNDHESYLMWKAYANKECAIQTTFERVAASFDKTQACIEGCAVQYIDYNRDGFDIGNTYTQISYKDLPYIDEKEYRLLFWKVGLENQKVEAGEKGIKIPIDIHMLIDNIYLNPSLVSNTDKLTELVKMKKLDCQIRETRIRE